jgi:hypothetical protein
VWENNNKKEEEGGGKRVEKKANLACFYGFFTNAAKQRVGGLTTERRGRARI